MKREDGFTLIELLIALSIFAMLAAAGVMLLSGSVRAQGQIAAKLDDLASVQRASALLTADLAQAIPRISRTESGTLAPAFYARGGAGGGPALQFVRTGRGNADGAPRSALQKLEYALVDGRLERRAYPLVDGSAAGAPSTVIEGVTVMQLRFRGEDGAWRGDWQVTNPTLLPRAVELTLTRGWQGAVRLLFLVGADPLPHGPAMVEPGPSERGAALLTVLLLVAVMSVITAGALERLTLGVRLSGNAAALDQARAFTYAAETLAATRIADLAASDKAKTTLQGNWNGNSFVLPIPGGLGTARLSDGGNCFNVNSVVTGANEVGGTPQLSIRPLGITQFRALMELLGVDNTSAVTIAASTADWIDTDDRPEPNGAESDVYQKAPTPYRTANQLMADPSELRVVNGMTPEIYSKLRPWLCALPVSDLSPINVNTLLPAQAPLFAMLIPGQLSIGQAREILSQRPQGGYANTTQFWSGPALKGLSPNAEVGVQTVMKTRWFAVESDIELADATVHESALYDAKYTPARLVRRSWADE